MFRSTHVCVFGISFLVVVSHASAQFTELAVIDLIQDEFEVFGEVGIIEGKVVISQSGTVSTPASVGVFEFDGTLVGSVQAPSEGENSFGAFVALDRGWLTVGDPFFKPSRFRTGRAYIYNNSFDLVHVLDDPAGRAAGQFGHGLDAVNGITAVSRRGSNVYFVDSASGEFLLDLEPPDGNSGFFGEEITILGDTMLVGAPGYPPADAGAFHVYDFPSGELRYSVFPEEPTEDALFGGTLAITSDRMFASASGSNTVIAYDREGSQVGQVSMSDSVFFGRSMVATEEFLAISLSTEGQVFLYDPMTLEPMGSIDGSEWGDEFGHQLAAKDNLLLVGPRRNGKMRLFSVPEPSADVLAWLCGFSLLLCRRRTSPCNIR